MFDSGVRFAAAFLPSGVAIIVGIVLAFRRRASVPRVARPALVGLVLHLVAVLVGASLLVVLPALRSAGWSVGAVKQLSSVVGLVTVVVTVLAWTMLLMALFRRLPPTPAGAASMVGAASTVGAGGAVRTGPATGGAVPPNQDDVPTGRHALLDARGAQVVAQEGASVYPVAAPGADAPTAYVPLIAAPERRSPGMAVPPATPPATSPEPEPVPAAGTAGGSAHGPSDPVDADESAPTTVTPATSGPAARASAVSAPAAGAPVGGAPDDVGTEVDESEEAEEVEEAEEPEEAGWFEVPDHDGRPEHDGRSADDGRPEDDEEPAAEGDHEDATTETPEAGGGTSRLRVDAHHTDEGKGRGGENEASTDQASTGRADQDRADQDRADQDRAEAGQARTALAPETETATARGVETATATASETETEVGPEAAVDDRPSDERTPDRSADPAVDPSADRERSPTARG